MRAHNVNDILSFRFKELTAVVLDDTNKCYE